MYIVLHERHNKANILFNFVNNLQHINANINSRGRIVQAHYVRSPPTHEAR